MENGTSCQEALLKWRYHVAKYLLFVLNFLVIVTGFVSVGMGVISLRNPSKLESLHSVAADPAEHLTWLGFIMVLIGICGCFGSLREHLKALKVFTIFLTMYFLMLIIGGLLCIYYLKLIEINLMNYLLKAIVQYEDEIDLQVAIDYIQRRFGCCGADSYEDWELNKYFNCSSPAETNCGVPGSCCKVNNFNMWCGTNTRGYGRIYAAHTIYTTGCINYLTSLFKLHLLIVGVIAVTVGVCEVFGLYLAMMMKTYLVKLERTQKNRANKLSEHSCLNEGNKLERTPGMHHEDFVLVDLDNLCVVPTASPEEERKKCSNFQPLSGAPKPSAHSKKKQPNELISEHSCLNEGNTPNGKIYTGERESAASPEEDRKRHSNFQPLSEAPKPKPPKKFMYNKKSNKLIGEHSCLNKGNTPNEKIYTDMLEDAKNSHQLLCNSHGPP